MHTSQMVLLLLAILSVLLSSVSAYPAVYEEGDREFIIPIARRSPSMPMRNCFFSPVQCLMPNLHFQQHVKRLY